MSQSEEEADYSAGPSVESVNARLRAQIAGISKDSAQGERKFKACAAAARIQRPPPVA